MNLGFEVVASVPFDGAADPARILLVGLPGGAFALIPVEDLIADRVGQFASGSAPEMLQQGKMLFHLHPNIDRDYLDQRIRHESSGSYGIELLQD